MAINGISGRASRDGDIVGPQGDIPVTEVTRNVIPHMDQETPTASYQAWRKEDTVVKTYRIDNDLYKGIWAESREDALAHCQANYGKVLEANYVPGRAFLRVMKAKP